MAAAASLLAQVSYAAPATDKSKSDKSIKLLVLDKTVAKPVKQFAAGLDWSLEKTLKFAGDIDKNQTLAIECMGYNPKMASLPLAFDLVAGGNKRTENLKGLRDKDSMDKVCEAKGAALKR